MPPPAPASDCLLPSDRLAAALAPLEKARTLPAEAFTSPEVYGAEVERLFRREWLCAGRGDQTVEAIGPGVVGASCPSTPTSRRSRPLRSASPATG